MKSSIMLPPVFKRFKYTLPDLPYDYHALEPVISAEIMQLHHSKHHATYVNNLNASLEQLGDAQSKQDLPKIAKLLKAVNFNAGGHENHSIFWNNLCPQKSARGEPSGKLSELIKRDFGSFANFQKLFSEKTIAIQGSGWGWLGYDKEGSRLCIKTTGNQDLLFSESGLYPLLGVDVWEHAYYLQYKNIRAEYVKAIWSVINWDDVSNRLSQCGN